MTADVYKGVYRSSIDVALKVSRGSVGASDTVVHGMAKEVELLQRLRHPSIVFLLGSTLSNGRVGMVMEWIERGSLHKVLHEKTAAPVSVPTKR